MISFFKWVITAVIVLLSLRVLGQYYDYDTTDSLKVIKLRYQTLDSNTLKRKLGWNELYNPTWLNIRGDTSFQLAYRTDNKNLWTMVSLPSFDHELFRYWQVHVSDFDWINIDRKGKPEVVLRGDCKVGWNYAVKWLKVISIEKMPVQIFSIFYGCNDRHDETVSLNDGSPEDSLGVKAHIMIDTTLFERDVDVSENGIVISGEFYEPDDKFLPEQEEGSLPGCCCRLTKIPGDRYVLRHGRIQKEK
jgi:hypothetical protein